MKTKAVMGIALAGLVSVEGSMIGTSVTGTVKVGSGSPNYFDPVNGFALGSALNASGTTVTVSGTATEFGYEEEFITTLTADFTGTQLFISESTLFGNPEIRMTFKDSAFIGAALSEFSDSFINGGASAFITGDTLTVDLPNLTRGGDFSAVFNITTQGGSGVPDGGAAFGMLTLGLGGLAMLRRRAS